MIDLGSGDREERAIPDNVLRDFIGGSGIGAWLMWQETRTGDDPLAPENPLMFLTGPMAGTPVTASSRHAVVAKSPLTGIWGESDVGGGFGQALKRAGYDGVIVRGKAAKPVYLVVSDGAVEIRDASHIWGRDCFETAKAVVAETASNAVVACIGPAGENLVKYASVMHDGTHARAAGRCGMGAVMGSKNLKAIAAYGSKQPPVARKDQVVSLTRELSEGIKKGTARMHQFGTAGIVVPHEAIGDLPIRNWAWGSWPDGAKKISGEKMTETILTRAYHCPGCFIGCGREVRVAEGPYAIEEAAGPEYETLGMLGACCLVDNLEAVAKANDLCNRYGLDTISTGGTIAFAMEAYEKGILTQKDVGGLDLRWGNPEALISLIHLIARREGIGDLLAEGTRRAAERLGGRAAEFAVHVKGLELPAHDPRAYNSLAIGYATSNRGACHLQGFSYGFEKSVTMPEFGWTEVFDRFSQDKAGLCKTAQDLMAAVDSLKLCKFLLYGGVKVTHMAGWLSAVTGWDVGVEELMRTGERIFNLKRMFNVREGISRKDDTLPSRILAWARGTGGAATNLPHLGKMLYEYYKLRGWSEDGIPEAATLERLGLGQIAGGHKLTASAR